MTKDKFTSEVVDTLGAIYERGFAAGKKEASTWIPVSERLPKAGEYVGDVAKYYLAQTEYGDMMVARYTHSGYWEQIYQLKPIGDEIVAWMQLPQPYKAESEDYNCMACAHDGDNNICNECENGSKYLKWRTVYWEQVGNPDRVVER